MLGGQIRFEDRSLTELDERGMESIRGAGVAMVYQDPMTSLNPLLRVRTQVVETLRGHGASDAAARKRTREVLGQVGFADPERVEAAFPHELSGGMVQRVMIAMAIATSPPPVGGRRADHGARRDDSAADPRPRRLLAVADGDVGRLGLP